MHFFKAARFIFRAIKKYGFEWTFNMIYSIGAQNDERNANELISYFIRKVEEDN